MSEDFVHLHTHSEHSNFDGCGKLGDFVKRAHEQGGKAIAFTEHGTIRHMMNFNKLIGELADEGVNIRPIYGAELYLCDNMHRKGATAEELAPVLAGIAGRERKQRIYEYERDNGIIGRYHLTVLAKNAEGLKNLMRITSLGWLKGFYKRPRVDIECIEQNAKGLVILSGCQSGSIGADYLANDPAAALEKVERLQAVLGEDFYGEIMPHDMHEQAIVNKGVLKISEAFDMPLVATQDAHYIDPEDWKYQEAMLCINTKTILSAPDRFKFSTQDFWLKNRKQLEESFERWHGSYLSPEQIKASLDNTVTIAEKCQAKIEVDRFKALVPQVEIPAEFNGDEAAYMRSLALEGWQTRNLDKLVRDEARRRRVSVEEMRGRYMKRLQHELGAIERQKCVRYFLVVWDLYKWARSVKIEVGPGRGSVGGSLVAFLLGITDVDPVRFELLFERFLNPARIDMPDIDMDFEDTRRQEVISRLRERYGDDCTAQIAANSKLTGKECLKSIARIMSIPINEIQPVVDAIVQRSSGDERASQTIEDSFEEFDVCRKFNAKYPQVLEYAKKLEGQVKGLGIHAAGVVVAPEPLINLVPLETREDKDGDERKQRITTAVDMYGVGDLGLMKLDVLGIRNLSAMRLCREAILERKGIDIDWLEIPLDCEQTLDNFTKHNYIGIFQFDTTSADKISEGVEFTSFEDVAAMIALDRPGTARSGLATEYLKRKKDPKAIESIHPIVDEICKDTLGVIVYQEHVQCMFTDVAGFSPATADSLRRKIAKKYGDEAIAKERTAFVEGACERGMDRKLAEKLIEQIKFFGSYGFNKSHSVAYGLIGYREMWLKTHYPIEFMWAVLAVEPGAEKIVRLVRAARKMGIEVRAADVNSPKPNEWTLDGDAIVGALSKIKGCGPAAVAAIQEARPFTGFIDFCERVERRKVNKRVVEVLLQAGAFNKLVPNPKWLYENLEALWEWVGKHKEWKQRLSDALKLSQRYPGWTEEEAEAISAIVNPIASGADPLEAHVSMIEQMRDDWIPMDAEDIWDRRGGFVWGRIIETRYNQVGDFHSGPEPDDEAKAKMGWGKRYANLNVEDRSGRNQRVKVDTDIFDTYRHIIDKGGAVIAAHVSINGKYHSMKASYLVDLDELKVKIAEEHDLGNFELALYKGWTPADTPVRLNGPHLVCGAMVMRCFRKHDKRGNEMAFLTLHCSDGKPREVVVFGSSWPVYSHRISPGVVAKFKLVKDKSSYILDSEVSGSMVEM